MTKRDLENAFEANADRFVDELKTLLRFSSVSAGPARHADCLNCADWLVAHLAQIGFEARLLETGTKPVVYGERLGDSTLPVVLFYGHYDVQPVDPIEAWESDPFDPTLRDGRIFARGAQDNKGQLFYALKAMQTLFQQGLRMPTIRVFIEGEEECGSDGLSGQLADWEDLIRSDILMVCDTGCHDINTPAIIMGLRGIIHLSISLRGANKDLHSGFHGGRVRNPATAMSRLLACLHDDEGRIAVDGYYDGVQDPGGEERVLANKASVSLEQYRSETGVDPLGGEPGFTPAERAGFRPSLDINGFRSGYVGAGIKTIIPAVAEAKLTSRLVSGQDPHRCLCALEAHLRAHCPGELSLEIIERGVGGPALMLNLDSDAVARARKVLRELSGKDPVFIWEGASIPLVASLREVANADALLVGFGLEEDAIHAPNESFSLDQFRKGFLYVGLYLARVAEG